MTVPGWETELDPHTVRPMPDDVDAWLCQVLGNMCCMALDEPMNALDHF